MHLERQYKLYEDEYILLNVDLLADNASAGWGCSWYGFVVHQRWERERRCSDVSHDGSEGMGIKKMCNGIESR